MSNEPHHAPDVARHTPRAYPPRMPTRSRLVPFLPPILLALTFAVAAGCAALAPALDALPGVVSAVEAVVAAAKANGTTVPADVLTEAKALDAAHELHEKSRDAQMRAILATVRRRPVACVPASALPVAADAGAPWPVTPMAALVPWDGGAETGR